jgi:hypothetical protein
MTLGLLSLASSVPARPFSRANPFDPARKMSEATATDAVGHLVRIVKGAFAIVAAIERHRRPLREWSKNSRPRAFEFSPLLWARRSRCVGGVHRRPSRRLLASKRSG